MPSSLAPKAQATSNGRKHPAPARVIPAIPLALSKPRTIPKPKNELQTTTSAAVATPAPQARLEAKDIEPPKEAEVEINDHHDGDKHTGQPVDFTARGTGRKHDVEEKVDSALVDAVSGSAGGSTPMSISDAATPDVALSQSSAQDAPSLPIDQPSPSTTISPAATRKPVDRYDMRHIKTELPPEFIPSSGQYTPLSATSSGRATSGPRAHFARPSANGPVFGGPISGVASPPPSTPFNPNFASSQHPPYYNGPNASQPPCPPPTHAHHGSESHSSRSNPHPAPNMSWDARHQFNGVQMPYNHQSSYRQQSHHDGTRPPHLNGVDTRSRSGSQASSAAHDRSTEDLQAYLGAEPGSATKGNFPEARPMFNGHSSRPPEPQHFYYSEQASRMENLDSLREHILVQFSNAAFTDCVLAVSETRTGAQYQVYGHRLILSRSPTLMALLSSPSSSLAEPVPVQLDSRYFNQGTIIDSIRFLYGGPLQQLDQARQMLPNGGSALPSNEERMQLALRYVAVGCWLKINAIAVRGMDLAANLLHWDTIVEALAFALDGGLSPAWSAEFEEKLSSASSESSVSRAETTRGPTFEPFATQFLQRIIHFLVHVLPQNFYLDSSASQLAHLARLPPIQPNNHDSRPSRSDPRLSKIRFGEVPYDDHQRPSFATSTISSVLLSIPYAVLKCVLENFDLAARLGPDTVASVMRQVVAEREARRIKALNALNNGRVDQSFDPRAVENLYWEETVESSAQHRAGFKLSRHKKEMDTPPSSGPVSEGSK